MPKRICPLEGNAELPALRSREVRKLLLAVWHMELAQADIHIGPEHDEILDAEIERMVGTPLSGLDIKLADLHLHVRQMLKMLEQMLAHEDWENDPLILVSRKEKGDHDQRRTT